MKKAVSWILAALLLLTMAACDGEPVREESTGAAVSPYFATDADVAQLEALYAGRQPYQGELHDHADTGGTSDGKTTLDGWKMILLAKDMDFTTIADHHQVSHMRLPEWDNTMFIGGTEAATVMFDCTGWQNNFHYNMLFAEPEGLENVLREFNSYQYYGDYFSYPSFVRKMFEPIVQSIADNGGFFVHVHPKGKSYMQSNDPLDYWFGDYTGIEVLCGYYTNMNDERNMEARQLWIDLLLLGKKVYATSGSDSHSLSNTVSLTTIYSEKQDAATYLGHVRKGDFTAGPIGIRMSMGETCTGGETDFAGKRLVVSVGEFHSLECLPGHTYRLDVYSDTGLVFSEEVPHGQVSYVAVDADPAVKFYRAEVYNVTTECIVSIGNPIWNEG